MSVRGVGILVSAAAAPTSDLSTEPSFGPVKLVAASESCPCSTALFGTTSMVSTLGIKLELEGALGCPAAMPAGSASTLPSLATWTIRAIGSILEGEVDLRRSISAFAGKDVSLPSASITKIDRSD